MNDLISYVLRAYQNKNMDYYPKGELWIGTKTLSCAGIEDNVSGHLEIRRGMGMDLIFFPLAASPLPDSNYNYRYFNIKEITEARRQTDGFMGVVIDGPFQRTVNRLSLMNFLSIFNREKKNITRILEKESAIVKCLINDCLQIGIQAIVVADDVAWEKDTYLHPKDINNLMFSFYSKVVNRVHEKDCFALFHSCGAISKIVPLLVTCGFDGLAGCQSECLDIVAIKRDYGKLLTILGGIDSDFLQTESLGSSQKQKFVRNLKILGEGGGFILCSSCGLHSQNNLKRLYTLYQIADQAFLS